MKRTIVLIGCVMMSAACLPPDDTRLADLSAEDRERACERYSYSAGTCEDGEDYDGLSEKDCLEYMEYVAGSDCAATIEDLATISADPCSDAADRSRSVLFSLECIFAGFR